MPTGGKAAPSFTRSTSWRSRTEWRSRSCSPIKRRSTGICGRPEWSFPIPTCSGVGEVRSSRRRSLRTPIGIFASSAGSIPKQCLRNRMKNGGWHERQDHFVPRRAVSRGHVGRLYEGLRFGQLLLGPPSVDAARSLSLVRRVGSQGSQRHLGLRFTHAGSLDVHLFVGDPLRL